MTIQAPNVSIFGTSEVAWQTVRRLHRKIILISTAGNFKLKWGLVMFAVGGGIGRHLVRVPENVDLRVIGDPQLWVEDEEHLQEGLYNRLVRVPYLLDMKFMVFSFFKKMGQPQPLLLFIFWSFKTNIITIFTINLCEKSPSSIQCWDPNPRPLEH